MLQAQTDNLIDKSKPRDLKEGDKVTKLPGEPTLNGLFTVENPAGTTSENERVLRALENLKRFMESFDFIRMAPDKGFLVSGAKAPEYHRALSEPGKQYALYIHHSSEKVGGAYTVVPGDYHEELVLNLPARTWSTTAATAR